jgi:hypothetical protein
MGRVARWVNRVFGLHKNNLPPFDHDRNPYKARTRWPPDVLKLSQSRQFYFERRWKRRMLMKSIRPKWNKGVKIFTWATIWTFTIYAVFFHDHRNDAWNPQPGEDPFEEVRDWTREFLRSIFGDFWTETAAKTAAKIEELRGIERAPASQSPITPENASKQAEEGQARTRR